jgi:hypothetical protein
VLLERRVVTLLTLALAAACGPGKGGSAPEPALDTVVVEEAETAGAVGVLSVDNQSIWETRVYLVRGGQYVRLGIAGSGAVVAFQMAPQYINRDLTFYVEAIGAAARLRTETAYVRSNQTVTLTLEKRLRSYSMTVH